MNAMPLSAGIALERYHERVESSSRSPDPHHWKTRPSPARYALGVFGRVGGPNLRFRARFGLVFFFFSPEFPAFLRSLRSHAISSQV